MRPVGRWGSADPLQGQDASAHQREQARCHGVRQARVQSSRRAHCEDELDIPFIRGTRRVRPGAGRMVASTNQSATSSHRSTRHRPSNRALVPTTNERVTPSRGIVRHRTRNRAHGVGAERRCDIVASDRAWTGMSACVPSPCRGQAPTMGPCRRTRRGRAQAPRLMTWTRRLRASGVCGGVSTNGRS